MAMVRFRQLSGLDKLVQELHAAQSIGKDLAADVYEDNGNLIVEMHVAGIPPDKIDISVEGDHLRVVGKREEVQETKDRDYYAKEIHRGSFERIIQLPAAVEKAKTRAEVRDGVLRIELPLVRQAEAHKVTVEKH